jgi:hypothetical protein
MKTIDSPAKFVAAGRQYGWFMSLEQRLDSATHYATCGDVMITVHYDSMWRIRSARFTSSGSTDRILGGINAVTDAMRMFGR